MLEVQIRQLDQSLLSSQKYKHDYLEDNERRNKRIEVSDVDQISCLWRWQTCMFDGFILASVYLL